MSTTKSDTMSLSPLAVNMDAFVRGIGHLVLMKVDPEAAKALNFSGFTSGKDTAHALAASRADRSHADGGLAHG